MFNSPVIMFAYAKINLALAIVSRREDGYHELETIMQSIDLHDTVQIQRKGLGLVCRCGELSGSQNLAYKAAEIFLRYWGKLEGIEIIIEKNIPLEAGLAGGSSDAATTLRALNELFSQPFNQDKLLEMAAECGADVPFCLIGGTMLATGKGEKLESLPAVPLLHLVLVKPDAGISTSQAYRRFDAEGMYSRLKREKWVTALSNVDINELAKLLHNDLEQASTEIVQEISVIKKLLLEQGCLGALMSGSGSAVFGIARDKEHAAKVVNDFRERGYRVWQTQTIDKNM